MKKKTVLLVLPLVCLFFLASGVYAKEKPVTIEQLFDGLPVNIVIHDSLGHEFHLTFVSNWGGCVTYSGYAMYPPDIPYPEVYLWLNQPWFEFCVTGLANDAYYGFSITGDAWTLNTYVLTHGYVQSDIQFFKGPITTGFQPVGKPNADRR